MTNNTIITVNPLELLEAAAEEYAAEVSEWNASDAFYDLVDRLVEGRLFRPDFTGKEDKVVWYQAIVSDLLRDNWRNGCTGWRRYGVDPEVALYYKNWAIGVAHGESRVNAWFWDETDEVPVEANPID